MSSFNFLEKNPRQISKNLSGIYLFSAYQLLIIRRGDLRSPAGERSSPLPCVPLFAKLRFANSPLVALLSGRGEFRSLRRATKAPRLGGRSLFEKSNAKTFKYGVCVSEPSFFKDQPNYGTTLSTQVGIFFCLLFFFKRKVSYPVMSLIRSSTSILNIASDSYFLLICS